jgi:hypothetical protein
MHPSFDMAPAKSGHPEGGEFQGARALYKPPGERYG